VSSLVDDLGNNHNVITERRASVAAGQKRPRWNRRSIPPSTASALLGTVFTESWLSKSAHQKISDSSPNDEVVNNRTNIKDWPEPIVGISADDKSASRATDQRMNIAEWKSESWTA
jgi:hypothetical protein